MATLFTKILDGELPCHRILEDQKFLAFLEAKPVNPGHTLVIPKNEVDYFFDLDDRALGEIMVFAKKVSGAIRQAISCKKVGVMIAGVEVPHAHIHLVPIITAAAELSFARARTAADTDLAVMAERIRSFLC
jgi:histidine triad (HIT) family protein